AAGEAFETLESALAEAAGAGLPLELARLLLVEAGAGGNLAEFVIQRALLGVAEDLEGCGHLLEALFRLLVPRIHVRMELLRQLPVRLFDLRRRRRFRHAQHGIRILHHCATVTMRLRVVKWRFRIPRGAAPSVTFPCERRPASPAFFWFPCRLARPASASSPGGRRPGSPPGYSPRGWGRKP